MKAFFIDLLHSFHRNQTICINLYPLIALSRIHDSLEPYSLITSHINNSPLCKNLCFKDSPCHGYDLRDLNAFHSYLHFWNAFCELGKWEVKKNLPRSICMGLHWFHFTLYICECHKFRHNAKAIYWKIDYKNQGK